MTTRWRSIVGRHAWWWFAVLVLGLFLGTRGLNEPDEGRYAEIAREMADGGDWLVPTLNSFGHFQKPPLLYWLTALSLRLFGNNEWAARLPSAMAGLGVVLLTCAIGRKLFSAEAGRNAAVVLVSGVEFFALARVLTPDMTMTFWIVAAIAAFVHRHPWLFFISMGLGFLTKGPMAFVVPLATGMAWQGFARGKPAHLSVRWIPGLSVSLAIGLSWFIALCLWRPELFDYFWRYELVERFGSHSHGRSQPWWFFIPVLLLGLFPWTFCLHGLMRVLWDRWRAGALEPRHALLLAWVGVPFVILSCSGSKLLTYVLPLLPALALAIGAGFRSSKPVWRVAVPSAICWLLLASSAGRFAPLLERQTSVRPLAVALSQHPGAEKALLFTCGVRVHGFAFYMNKVVATTKADADIVLPLSASDAGRVFRNVRHCADVLTTSWCAYGIVDQNRYEEHFKQRGWRSLGREGAFLLITNDRVPAVVQAR